MKLDTELHDQIARSCENMPDSTNGRIGWLHERISVIEQALLIAHDRAVKKEEAVSISGTTIPKHLR